MEQRLLYRRQGVEADGLPSHMPGWCRAPKAKMGGDGVLVAAHLLHEHVIASGDAFGS